MKKIITCVLILSLLGAMGTMCFAWSSGGYMEGGHWVEVDDDDWGSPSDDDYEDDASYEEADENSADSERE